MHVHQSVFKDGKNIFYDNNRGAYLSEKGEWFINGLLEHAEALAAVFAPTENSYERLKPGFEAPTRIAYGFSNRSTLIRVPKNFTNNPNAERIEFRGSDPRANPYLLFLAMFSAGMNGIENKIKKYKPTKENAYHIDDIKELPGSLEQAIEKMKGDKVIEDAFGKELFESYINTLQKRKEHHSNKTNGDEQKIYVRNPKENTHLVGR